MTDGRMTYAIMSYGTPIAFRVRTDNGPLWIVPGHRYSVTTSGHQSATMAAIHYTGEPVTCSLADALTALTATPAHADYPHEPGTLYLVPNAAHVLLWHGTDLVPVGPSGRRFWPDRAELVAELRRDRR